MNYNSTIHGELLAVLDSPTADPQDSRAEIPPKMNLVMTPGSISRPDTPGTRSESHWAGDARTVANAVLSSAVMTTLKKGIWRITGTYSFCSSVVAVPAQSTIRVSQGGSVVGNLSSIFPHTTLAVQSHINLDQQLTLDRDTDIINLVNATGVGERSTGSCALHFQRIA